jgi:putative oxidoreductase
MKMDRNEAPLSPGERQGNTTFAVSVALLVLRLVLGWIFIYHGSQKLFGAFGGPGMGGFANTLAKLGLPGILPPMGWAYVAACGEFFGGISVFLGLVARLGAIPIIASMLVAIGGVVGKNGFSVVHGGYEYNLLIIAGCVAIIIAGPGIISADALFFRRGLWARGPQPLGEAQPRGRG